MPTHPEGPRGRSTGRTPWWRRLGDLKVTPAVVLLFFMALVVLSAAAAGIGFVAHHFRASVGQPR